MLNKGRVVVVGRSETASAGRVMHRTACITQPTLSLNALALQHPASAAALGEQAARNLGGGANSYERGTRLPLQCGIVQASHSLQAA